MTQTVDELKDHTTAFQETSLGHKPEGAWTFDDAVTDVFDDMLARSIPQYHEMRKACFDFACRYQKDRTTIVDLGCSRGGAIADLVEHFGAHNRFVGTEISEPMLEAARERFAGEINTGIVDIKKLDLRERYPVVNSSVTMCILTLQFTPIEHRLRIVQDIYDSTVDGGALILVEKVLGSSAIINKHMVDIYYELKHANGYTWDEIERKRLSLEGVLVPMTARFNEELLSMCGFRQIDCFWRWMNFMGWVAVK